VVGSPRSLVMVMVMRAWTIKSVAASEREEALMVAPESRWTQLTCVSPWPSARAKKVCKDPPKPDTEIFIDMRKKLDAGAN